MHEKELKELKEIHKAHRDRYDELLTELRKAGRGEETVANNFRIAEAYHRGAYDAYRHIEKTTNG